MPSDPKIADFVEKALAAGIPHDSLVGILTAEGWPEKEIYQALADHYRRVTGIDIPRRAGAATSAKDAFFYLLVFGTLSVWTFAVGAICFELIDYWLRDPLFTSYTQSLDTSVIASCIAAIFVTFPIFLLLSRAVAREIAAQPEKLDSGIRKWLTYMALVIAAATFMGDLIGIIAYLLRGEFTSRFLAKSFVVLVLSGGVFFYYFGGLRKAEHSQQDMIAKLTLMFGGLALILAAVGLYGVTAYTVEQRTSEIGIRMALGANRRTVLVMVLRAAFMQIGFGLAIGVPAAIGAGRLITGQLYAVKPYDPAVLTLAALALGSAALMASLIPAQRAAATDPMNALRSE